MPRPLGGVVYSALLLLNRFVSTYKLRPPICDNLVLSVVFFAGLRLTRHLFGKSQDCQQKHREGNHEKVNFLNSVVRSLPICRQPEIPPAVGSTRRNALGQRRRASSPAQVRTGGSGLDRMRISNGHMCQIRAPGQLFQIHSGTDRQRSKCVLSRDGQDSHGTSRLMSFSHRMASEVVVRNRIRPINVYYPCERVTETRTSDTETRTETGPNPVRGLCARPSRISCGGSTMTRRGKRPNEKRVQVP